MNRQSADRARYWLSAVFFVIGTAVLGSTFKEFAFLGGFAINTLRAHIGHAVSRQRIRLQQGKATWILEGANSEVQS
jgi:hypothetical protein